MRNPASKVLEGFLATAATRPERTAIVHNGRNVSYGELRTAAATVAKRLGNGPGVVGVPVTHTPAAVANLLGIWWAGGAYCPVDPTFPASRRQAMLTAAGCRLALTADAQVANTESGADARDEIGELAYVLFTSGSTGAPKPVLTPHRAVDAAVTSLRALFEVTLDDRVLQFASLNWDTCFEEILPALTSGACLVMDDDVHSGSFPRFLRAVARHEVTVLDLPTAYWHELVRHLRDSEAALPACVRLVVIGGEAANPARLADWRRLPTGHARLLNTYGATETTLVTHAIDLHGPRVDASHLEPAGPVPIGRPLPHVDEHITDDGELLIGGPSVACGYGGLPDANRHRFVHIGSHRYFRTGDRVSRSPDGTLVPRGRIDAEVKIRGIRVDPAEVEAHIAGHPAVAAVAVTGVRAGDHTALEAFVVPGTGVASARLATDVLGYLRARLPSHLVPRRIHVVPALAYTPSGKVDRQRMKEAIG